MAERLLKTLRSLNPGVAIAGSIMLLACAAVVLLDIGLRQLGASFGGTDEISGYAMAIATSMPPAPIASMPSEPAAGVWLSEPRRLLPGTPRRSICTG